MLKLKVSKVNYKFIIHLYTKNMGAIGVNKFYLMALVKCLKNYIKIAR